MSASGLEISTSVTASPCIGPSRLDLVLDGEIVRSGKLEFGYLHRGIEKVGERVTWQSFFPFIEKVDYLSSIHCTLAYALAVESLAGVQVSKRAQRIRVLASELNRIASHLYWISQFANSLGATAVFHYALRDREKINNLFEMLCGARLTYNYIRIGGVALDVTDGFIERVNDFLVYFSTKKKEYDELLSDNPIFKGRLSGVGVITAAEAICAGATGPNLRASGAKIDERRERPYSGYEEFDFEVVTGDTGDCFQRYLVRVGEIEQSVAIVKQALTRMPEGEYLSALPRVFKAPEGRAYAAVESSRGSFGVFVESRGDKIPYRVKIRPPSLAALNLFPSILKDATLADASLIVSSLDISSSEVDR